MRAKIRAVMARLHGGELSARRLGFSVALGLFVGCSPLYGLHSLVTAGLAFVFRLDVLIAYLASNISLPPAIPFLLFAEMQVGSIIMHGRVMPLKLSELAPERALQNLLSLSVGAVVVGGAIACLGGGVAWALGRRLEIRRDAESPPQ